MRVAGVSQPLRRAGLLAALDRSKAGSPLPANFGRNPSGSFAQAGTGADLAKNVSEFGEHSNILGYTMCNNERAIASA